MPGLQAAAKQYKDATTAGGAWGFYLGKRFVQGPAIVVAERLRCLAVAWSVSCQAGCSIAAFGSELRSGMFKI